MSKKKKKSRGGLAGVYDLYAPAKPGEPVRTDHTVYKSLIDVILGVPIGVGIGAASGLWSLPLGALMIAAGHHLREQSGLLRVGGAAAIAYGIAKNVEFNAAAKAAKAAGVSGLAGTTAGVKDRLKSVKDELLSAYYLDRIFKKPDAAKTEAPATKMAEVDDEQPVGAIDLSALDMFDEFNAQAAGNYDAELAEREFQQYENPDPVQGFSQAVQPSGEAAFNLYDDEDEIDPSDY